MDYYENESKCTISDDRVNDPSSIEIKDLPIESYLKYNKQCIHKQSIF